MASTASGTDDASSSDEQGYQPPCRQAERYIVSCPMCGRRVQLKTLHYSHVCGRSFDPTKRALEQQRLAVAALKARLARAK